MVMVSSLTTDGARETLDALENGAVDFLAKPGGAISLDFESVGDELIRILTEASHCALPKIDPGGAGTVPFEVAEPRPPSVAPARPKQPAARTGVLIKGTQRLVVIASSTGGPKALAGFIPHLPRDTRAAMVLVQHMPATFTRLLAERLNKASRITVREARDGDPLLRGVCLVAPGGFHLEITREETVRLTKDPPIGGLRPCADITLHSAAAVFGSRAVGVVLTGMGHDGTAGCRALRKHGAKILAESRETALIYGMPKSIVDNNLHDRIEPIHNMARAVVEMI